jgi:hypothetical protein
MTMAAVVIDIATRSEVLPREESIEPAAVTPVMEHLTNLEVRLDSLRWMAFCQRQLCRTCLDEVPEARIGMAEGQALEGLLALARQIEDLILSANARFQVLHEAVVRHGTVDGRA